MAQMLVRDIDDAVAARFKARAEAEGKTAEQVLREMIEDYANGWDPAATAQLSQPPTQAQPRQ